MEERGGFNLYGFVGNSPIFLVDIDGRGLFGGIAGAVVGGIAGAESGAAVGATYGGIGGTLVEPGGGTVVGGIGGGVIGGIIGGIGGAITGGIAGDLAEDLNKSAGDGNEDCPKADDPGMPTEDDGYKKPKKGKGADGGKVKNPNGTGKGWADENGDVWVPTGHGGTAHGGPHWDVQRPDGSHTNRYPGGRQR